MENGTHAHTLYPNAMSRRIVLDTNCLVSSLPRNGKYHRVWQDFFAKNDVRRMWCLSTKAPRCYTQVRFQDGDYLFFGKETKGLPEDFLEAHRECCVRLPMRQEARSLNLSNSVAITVYEALRQLDFPGLQDCGKMANP